MSRGAEYLADAFKAVKPGEALFKAEMGVVTQVSPLRVLPDSAFNAVDIGPLPCVRGLPALGDHVMLLRGPGDTMLVLGKTPVPSNPPSIQTYGGTHSTGFGEIAGYSMLISAPPPAIGTKILVIFAVYLDSGAPAPSGISSDPDGVNAGAYTMLVNQTTDRLSLLIGWKTMTSGDIGVDGRVRAALTNAQDIRDWYSANDFHGNAATDGSAYLIGGASGFSGSSTVQSSSPGGVTVPQPDFVAVAASLVIGAASFVAASRFTTIGAPGGTGPGFGSYRDQSMVSTVGVGAAVAASSGTIPAGAIGARNYNATGTVNVAITAVVAAEP